MIDLQTGLFGIVLCAIGIFAWSRGYSAGLRKGRKASAGTYLMALRQLAIAEPSTPDARSQQALADELNAARRALRRIAVAVQTVTGDEETDLEGIRKAFTLDLGDPGTLAAYIEEIMADLEATIFQLRQQLSDAGVNTDALIIAPEQPCGCRFDEAARPPQPMWQYCAEHAEHPYPREIAFTGGRVREYTSASTFSSEGGPMPVRVFDEQP